MKPLMVVAGSEASAQLQPGRATKARTCSTASSVIESTLYRLVALDGLRRILICLLRVCANPGTRMRASVTTAWQPRQHALGSD